MAWRPAGATDVPADPGRARVRGGRLPHELADVRRPHLGTRQAGVVREFRRRAPQLVGLTQHVRSRTPPARGRTRETVAFHTSRRCSTESRIGVNGFLISWAMIRAISAHAARRFDRTTSDTSSMTAMRRPPPPRGSGTVTTRQRSPGRGSSSADTWTPETGEHVCARAAIASPGKTSSSVAPSTRPRPRWADAGLASRTVAIRAVGHDTGRQLGEKRRQALLLPGQRLRLLLQAARHVEERPDELAQLLVGRLVELRREIAARDRARSLHEIRHGPGDAHRQPPGDRRGDQEDQKAERRTPRRSAARPPPPRPAAAGAAAARGAPGFARRALPGTADSAVMISSNRLSRDDAAPPRAPAPRRGPTATKLAPGTRDGQKARGVEVAAGARHETRVGRVHREVEPDGVGEPGERGCRREGAVGLAAAGADGR